MVGATESVREVLPAGYTAGGFLMVVSGPSGVGKGTLVERLLKARPECVLSISATTRARRPHETDGEEYYFLTPEEFLRRREAGLFLESAEVHGYRYGTAKKVIEQALKQGDDLILEIDWQGAAQVRSLYPDCVGIFIVPPSLEELERRKRT